MRKVIRLTESDLTKIVKRVIHEKLEIKIVEPDWKGYAAVHKHMNQNPDQADVLKDVYDGKAKHPSMLMMVGAHEIVANWNLKQHLRKYGNKISHILLDDCEGVDLSDINFCEYPNLATVILRGTPNNFEETQNKECYEKHGHIYFLNGHGAIH